ncbi:MAG: Gfo/Idh/MocA family oxidoreductase [Gemmatimonadota bacterium]
MSERQDVRVGVVGLGAIAQVVHLPVLAHMQGVRIGAVSDVDRPRARAIADRFGVDKVHARDEDLFADDELDAVVLCTPNHLHEEQAVAALEAGRHALVEKPLALTPEGCRRVVAAAEAAGRCAMVAMNNRFRPDVQALFPFARGGELGEIFLARGAWLNRKARQVRPTWRHRLATSGGGALMDLGVQTLDLCLWMLDYPEPASVVCHTHRGEGMEVEDTGAILVRLENGACISLTVSWSLAADRDRHYMRLLGSRGSGAIAPLGVYKEVDGAMLDVTPALPSSGRENIYTASYRRELERFVEMVRGERPAEPPTEQERLMRLVGLAYRSAAEQREVEA